MLPNPLAHLLQPHEGGFGLQDVVEQAYRNMLDSCYACHLAADKPYLKLRIPERPETPIVDFKGK